MSNMSESRNRSCNRDRKAAKISQRADFVSTAQGHSSYIERNWARVNDWAAVERPDLHPAPVLTPKAKAIVHRFTLTPEARRILESERNHADRD